MLRKDQHSVRAWIGLADICINGGNASEAEEYLKAAVLEARKQGDYDGLLRALDVLAFLARERKDEEAVVAYLGQMCAVLPDVGELDELPLGTVEMLLEDGEGAKAIPYLECLAGQLAKKNTHGGNMNLAARFLYTAYRQAGIPDEEIRGKLLEFKPWASEPRVDRILRSGKVPGMP